MTRKGAATFEKLRFDFVVNGDDVIAEFNSPPGGSVALLTLKKATP